MRSKIPLIVSVAIIITIFAIYYSSSSKTRHGFTLNRENSQTIRISWGTPSSGIISPEFTLNSSLGFNLRTHPDSIFPPIVPTNKVWMYDIQPENHGTATMASYINPLNDHAFDQMFEMIRLAKLGNSTHESATRIAAQNYTYLGYVVQNDDDIKALKHALTDRANISLMQDLHTQQGTLYRLAAGVEKHFASDPSDPIELQNLRRTIPVMFELINCAAGHPADAMHVLYLDGHIERITIGDKFPATNAFIQAFPPAPPA